MTNVLDFNHGKEFPVTWITKFGMEESSLALKTILKSQGISEELSELLANSMSEIAVDSNIVKLLRAAGSEKTLCEWLLYQPKDCRELIYKWMAHYQWGKFERTLKLIGKGFTRNSLAYPAYKINTEYHPKDFLSLLEKALKDQIANFSDLVEKPVADWGKLAR